eukprot:GHVS01076957.1.p1 GENE.GHVS01076957.1~~GHVS01076957.1.p1  ORF type:complete len:368 (-),score=100.02 GHVS01076957.1:680-1783(-)
MRSSLLQRSVCCSSVCEQQTSYWLTSRVVAVATTHALCCSDQQQLYYHHPRISSLTSKSSTGNIHPTRTSSAVVVPSWAYATNNSNNNNNRVGNSWSVGGGGCDTAANLFTLSFGTRGTTGDGRRQHQLCQQEVWPSGDVRLMERGEEVLACLRDGKFLTGRSLCVGIQRGGVSLSPSVCNLRAFSTNRPPPEAHPAHGDYNPDWWRTDDKFQQHKSITRRSLKVGPYKRGKMFVSPKEDPQTFVVNCILIGVTVYTIFTLTPGESYKSRRNRVVRKRLYTEYGLTEADVDEIEGYEVPLSSENDDDDDQQQRAGGSARGSAGCDNNTTAADSGGVEQLVLGDNGNVGRTKHRRDEGSQQQLQSGRV